MFDNYANRHPRRQPQTWVWGGRPEAGMMRSVNSVAIHHEASSPVGKLKSVGSISFTEVKLKEHLHPSALFLHSLRSTQPQPFQLLETHMGPSTCHLGNHTRWILFSLWYLWNASSPWSLYLSIWMCSFLPRKEVFSLTVYTHLAKTVFFPFSAKTPERKKPYLSASPSLTFRWFSFFLLSLHACWTSWFHVLVGQLHSYIWGHRFNISLLLSPGQDFYTFQASMDTFVPKFFKSTWLVKFVYISASSKFTPTLECLSIECIFHNSFVHTLVNASLVGFINNLFCYYKCCCYKSHACLFRYKCGNVTTG